MKPSLIRGSISYVAASINELPKDDTMSGIKTANFTNDKVQEALKTVKIERKKAEKKIDSQKLAEEIQEDLYR